MFNRSRGATVSAKGGPGDITLAVVYFAIYRAMHGGGRVRGKQRATPLVRRPKLMALRLAHRLRSLKASTFARNVAVLAGGTAIGQVVLIAVSPVLTRVYSPADLGRFAIFNAAVSVCSAVVSLRYEAAIVSAKQEDVPSVTVLASTLIVPMSLLATLLVALGSQVGALGLGELRGVATALVLPSLVFAGTANILRFWFIRKEQMRPISVLVIVQNSVRALSQVVFGIGHLGWLGLLLGDASGRASGVLGLTRTAYRQIRTHPEPRGPRELLAAAVRYRHFSTYYLLSSLIDVVSLSLPIPLMAQAFGAAAAGQFALVQRVVAAPLALIAATFADAFHGRLATLARAEPSAAVPFFWRSAKALVLLSLGPFLLLLALGARAFPLVFGPQWVDAGLLAVITAPWALGQFVVGPLTRTVLVYDGQRVKLVYDLTTLGLVVGVFAFARRAHLPIISTTILLTVVETISYALYFVLLVLIVRRRSAVDGLRRARGA